MNESIDYKTGDPVQLVKWCCLKIRNNIPPFFTAGKISIGPPRAAWCIHCSSIIHPNTLAVCIPGRQNIPANWVKKVPPLDEPIPAKAFEVFSQGKSVLTTP